MRIKSEKSEDPWGNRRLPERLRTGSGFGDEPELFPYVEIPAPAPFPAP